MFNWISSLMNLIIVLELLCYVYKTFPYVQSFSFLSRFKYCTRTSLWCIQDFSIGSVFFFPLFKRESGDQVETQGLTTERIQPKFNCIVIDVNNLKAFLDLLYYVIQSNQPRFIIKAQHGSSSNTPSLQKPCFSLFTVTLIPTIIAYSGGRLIVIPAI